MMFELGSFNLINEFERASNESNADQLASSSAQLQPYLGAQVAVLNHKLLYWTVWDRFMQVLLPIQRRLCPIFMKNVGSPDIHEYSAG